ADLKYQLFERSREALQKLLEERPQIFVFDDIHNAQPLLLELIQYLQKMLIENDQLPLLLLCSGDLAQPIPSVVHTLERLTALDISDILEKMCGKDPGIPQLATKLHKETEGIPLFLVEFIHTLIRNGQILHGKRFRFTTPPGKIADMSFDIPPGIRQIAREQHKELSDISRNIVEILAVGGKELDVDIILDSLEEDEDLVLDNLERLEKRGVLSCRYIGMDPWYELARRKYGTIVYEEMNSQKRLSYHRSIAENLESRGSIGVSSAQQIGEHYRLAHEAGKAYQVLATATLRLWDRGLAAECVELLQRATPLLREAKIALPHLEFIETRLKFLKVQANIFQNKGEWHQATKTFRSMLRYAKEIDNWEYSAQAELGLGILALQLNQLDVGERRFEMVLDEAEKRKDKNLILSCLHYMCALAWQKGDLQKCEALAKVGLLRTKKGELSIARAQILLSLSAVLATTGKIKKAGEEMEEAAMIFAKLLRKEKHATLLCNLAEIQIWQGKIGSAIHNSKKALDLCQNTMFRSGEAHANLSLAIALYSIGCIDEALPHLNNSIRISKEAHLSDHNISARYWLAKVFIQMNNDQAAEMHTIDAILNCEEGDPERHLLALRALRAIILINQGKKTAAKQLLNIIEPGLVKLPWPRRLETMFHLAKALLLLNERRKAHEIARFVANKAIEIDFWILSLHTHQLLLKINPHDDSAKKQRDIQLIALSKNLPSQYSKHLQSLFED
ncbi:MAG: hypothetical protein VX278_11170, partial [Myxococcota bacterium]|nr:hypothetical protein [Myxococcota bacterium]